VTTRQQTPNGAVEIVEAVTVVVATVALAVVIEANAELPLCIVHGSVPILSQIQFWSMMPIWLGFGSLIRFLFVLFLSA
jgi:hypothetical protein